MITEVANEITIDAMNIGSFLGPLATKYAYMPAFRRRLDEVYQAACRSTNRYFVMEGDIVRAAGSTKSGALKYMDESRVLVYVDIPDIDALSHEQLKAIGEASGNKAMFWAARRACEYLRLAGLSNITSNAIQCHLDDAEWWRKAAVRAYLGVC